MKKILKVHSVNDYLTYGLTTYDLHRHALMCVAPGQIGGKADTDEEIQTKGWALLFAPELLNGTDLEQRMSTYTYFSYNTNEALLMTDDTAGNIIRRFVMQQAQKMLVSGTSITATAEQLGFEIASDTDIKTIQL